MGKKCKCGKKRYGYGDGIHEIWICYNCGKFVGKAGGDFLFSMFVQENPNIIMGMINEKILKPINDKNGRYIN